MSGMLPRYFRRRVVVQILALLAVLTALLQMLELLDMTTEVLKREQGLRGLLYYAALRTPAEVVLMLPLAVLLGTMTAMHSMARNLEITTVRCAGVSLMRIFAYLLPVALVLAVLQFAIAERVLPQAENTLKAWWSASAPAGEASTRLWVNTDRGPVSIDSISPDGTHLRGLRLYVRDAAGLIESRAGGGRRAVGRAGLAARRRQRAALSPTAGCSGCASRRGSGKPICGRTMCCVSTSPGRSCRA